MGIFLFSLTGLPPLAGFVGKFFLFAAVIDAKLYWLAVVGILNSVVALYYYVRILRAMFLDKIEEVETAPRLPVALSHSVLLVVLAAPTVLLGILWAPLANLVNRSVGFMF